MSTRLIHRSAARPHRMIAEVLQALFIGELLSPGRRLLLVSPWISDVPILDNRAGRFSSLDVSWGAHWIPISTLLRSLLQQQVQLRLAIGAGAREDDFVNRVQQAARRDGTADALWVRRPPTDGNRRFDHEKAIVADTWAVYGSMNLTYRGVELNGELVTVTTEAEHLAAVATELLTLFS